MGDAVAEWTPAQVAAWITTTLDMPLLAGKLRKMGVTGKKLLLLDHHSGNKALRTTYEVAVLGDRLKILDAIQKLREHAIEKDSNFRWAQIDDAPRTKQQTAASQTVADALGRKRKAKSSRDGDNVFPTIAPWRANAFPPLGFVDPEEAGRAEPAVSLELDFVYGYRGHDRHANLFYNVSGELVYSVAKLAVVFNLESRSQRFFSGHQDDVSCIAMHEDGVLVASGEAGRRGAVYVWDTQSMETVQTLLRPRRGKESEADNSISCVAFAADMDKLVSVGDDMEITVWDWQNQTVLVETSAGTGKIFSARVNHFQKNSLMLVTAGTSCVRFWSFKEKTATLEDRWGVVRELGSSQTALCIDFLDKSTTVTGMQDGSIYIWQGYAVAKSIENAHGGVVFDVCVAANFLLSGAQDGKIHKWSLGSRTLPGGSVERTVLLLTATVDAYEVSSGLPLPCTEGGVLTKLDEMLETPENANVRNGSADKPKNRYWDKHTPCVRSLAVLQGTGDGDAARNVNIAFGLESNQIMQLETGPALTEQQGVCQVLLHAHAADAVHGMALHPQLPMLCTTGADQTIRLWDLRSKRLVAQHRPQRADDGGRTRAEPLRATCCDFSPKHPHHLAAGLDDGTMMAFAYESSALVVVHRDRFLKSRVTCVRFSPGGEKLAVAYKSSAIVLLATGTGDGDRYKPLRTLSVSLGGHAVALDWSEGGHGGSGSNALFLQGTTNVMDLLFWEVDNGRQLRVSSEMRDVNWSTYNCPVGWPLLGLFSGGKDAHEVSCVSRVGKDLAVAGTKDGSILLSRFPSLDQTKLKVTAGHRGEVSGVRGLSLGSVGGGKQTIVVSVGDDLAVMQWRLKQQSSGVGGAYTRAADASEDPLIKVLMEPWPTATTLRPFVAPNTDLHWRNSMAAPVPGAVARTSLGVGHLSLQLEMVHGYSGQYARGNIFCSEEGELIYPVGRLVVVLDVDKQQQKIYTNHSAPVSCIAACDVPQVVLLHFIRETHGAPPEGLRANESLVASAQAGNPSFVHIWDAGTMLRHSKLEIEIHVMRLAFAGSSPMRLSNCMLEARSALPRSPETDARAAGDDKSLLVIVGGERAPVSIAVWEWLNGTPLAEVASDKGPITDLCCNYFYDPQSLEGQVPWAVTCHTQGVAFWTFTCSQSKGQYLSRTGALQVQEGVLRHPGEDDSQPAAICAELLNGAVMLSGMGDGDILVWKGVKTVSRVRRAHHGAVLALAYAPLADDVVSGGEDGVIKVWQGSTMGSSQVNMRRVISGVTRQGEAAVRAVCAGRGNFRGRAAVGLSINEIKEVVLKEGAGARSLTHSHVVRQPEDSDAEGRMVRGQWGGVSMCAHPTENRYVTVGIDGHVRVWEVGRERRGVDRRLAAGLLCCCFSRDGLEVAVGADNGTVWVLLAANLSPIAEMQPGTLAAVTAVSFSPDGAMVAVGGLFTKRGQARAAVIVEALAERRKGGHEGDGGWSEAMSLRSEGRVLRIDWSSDGRWLQVVTEAGEMLYVRADGTAVDAGSGSAWEQLRASMTGSGMGFETWSAPVGWAVQGLLGKHGGEVSAVDRGFQDAMLAVGRRDGSVRLMDFPADEEVEDEDRSKLVKHTSAVWNVCFVGGRTRQVTSLVKPARVVSAGVGDEAVYQWLLVDKRKAATDMQRLVRGNRARKAAEKKRREKEKEKQQKSQLEAAAGEVKFSDDAGTAAAQSAEAAEHGPGHAHPAVIVDDAAVKRLLDTMEEKHAALVAVLRRSGLEAGVDANSLQKQVERVLEAQELLLTSLTTEPRQPA